MEQTQPWHSSFDDIELDTYHEKIAQLFIDKLNEQQKINPIDEILQLLNSEIKWCEGQDDVEDSQDALYKDGFIGGLEQAILLIGKYQRKEYKEK
jgi:hypothetical protein